MTKLKRGVFVWGKGLDGEESNTKTPLKYYS